VRQAATEVWPVELRGARLCRGRGRQAVARQRLMLNLGRCHHQVRRPPTERPTSPPAPAACGGEGRNQSPPMRGWPPSSDAASLPQSTWARSRRWATTDVHPRATVSMVRSRRLPRGPLMRRFLAEASVATGVYRGATVGASSVRDRQPSVGHAAGRPVVATGCSASGSAVAGCFAVDRMLCLVPWSADCGGDRRAERPPVVAAAEHTRLPRHPRTVVKTGCRGAVGALGVGRAVARPPDLVSRRATEVHRWRPVAMSTRISTLPVGGWRSVTTDA
jgi:hypothetical protein